MHYSPINNSHFKPTNLMEPKAETIPTNERLKIMGKEFATCAYEARMKIWDEASRQWDGEKEGDKIMNKWEKCKGCTWGTKSGNCVLVGEERMTCRANDFSEYSESKKEETI